MPIAIMIGKDKSMLSWKWKWKWQGEKAEGGVNCVKTANFSKGKDECSDVLEYE